MTKLTLSTLSLTLTLVITGCSTLHKPKQIQSKIIDTHRANITTRPQISAAASSILLSSGLTQDECMNAFDDCLDKVKEVLAFGNPQVAVNDRQHQHIARPTLALLSELYYTKALSLGEQDACQSPTRPPLDPYYANAPLSASEQADKQKERHACLSAKRDAIKASINHSYAYLFYDSLTGQKTTSPLVTENDIKAQDLYHVASNALIGELYQAQNGAFANAHQQGFHLTPTSDYGHILANSYHSDDVTVNLYLAHDSDYMANLDVSSQNQHLLSDLVSAYDSRLADLNTTSSRAGLGVPYVGVLPDRRMITLRELVGQNQSTKPRISHAIDSTTADPADNPTDNPTKNIKANNPLLSQDLDSIVSRIHPTGHMLLTGVVKPQGTHLSDVLSANVLDVHFFNPYKTKDIEILGKNYPLSANFSAGYALWLAENQLQGVGILNMLNKNTATLPQLFMLKPYDPNQKVIIMIHGLASSPATWVNLTNNLFADPVLRDNYQVWQVFYATNLPMLENRYQIREVIDTAYALTDPNGTHLASQHSVIIGHSMGGIMARMLVSDDDLLPRLDDLGKLDDLDKLVDATHIDGMDNGDLNKITNNQTHPHDNTLIRQLLADTYQENFNNRFALHALPQVDTAVFISAPFAGTDYADRWFTRFARRVVRLPLDITKTVTGTIINSGQVDSTQLQNSAIGSLYLQNGPSQLSDQSAFIKLTKELTINDNVAYHTIMGDRAGSAESLQGNLVGQNLSDGIVPYDSSHLDGAVSETVVTGGHNIHENPKTILQLRKILHEHLARHGDHTTTDVANDEKDGQDRKDGQDKESGKSTTDDIDEKIVKEEMNANLN
ncbi:lipase family alpha/beta hydrolase [Moraxella bovis]|uniref:Alpha/beta hydrolase n=1 Tax=Moraxella bovis TaxID=476 RepID=A0AAQ2Q6B2_MORBO|nr:alpha/beta hydrolase [Moraxella bovis]AWY20207.1 alpha/beta hydrolase [Moraxella bovis]UYZ74649.1 alpha/beta hydrolase [Moraxella bovis]UYZ79426.1 alpha/beta hydrolase [Moraxella bovis]UYZ87907.1 alpha/beta hydrolase [Moraxella bovis]UYZ93310.1 alpha/beta hydrolase [Moraxella bovis]